MGKDITEKGAHITFAQQRFGKMADLLPSYSSVHRLIS
ncbi:hypothetical protein AQEC111735_13440 [Aquirufa ecclesiirivi]